MIRNFRNWFLVENFGNGTETFEQTVSTEKLRNLDIFAPVDWEVDSANGKVIYEAELEVDKSGIEGIIFTIKSIELEIDLIQYGENDEESTETKSFLFDSDNMGDVKIEVEKLPYYLSNLEVDFRQAEDLDGEIDLKKVKIEATFGYSKS